MPSNHDTAQPSTAETKSARRPRRVLTYVIVGAALLSAAGALAARRQGASARALLPGPRNAQPPAPRTAVAAKRPRVEMVFALDTTGSMSGLIEGAKRKIWSLASFVAQGQPTPDLRVGLVGFRDRGDTYVTRRFDLDDDLDRVFKNLHGFSADGGGDTPEHVARALHEAVNEMSWSSDPAVVKVIYLVGDAPLGVLPAHLERHAPDRVDAALAALGGTADSPTHALAERARVAFRRLEAGLAHTPGAESPRLVQLAESGTLQACALARRCGELRAELAATGRAVLEERRACLASRLDATSDPEARRSLQAACAETREIAERVSALAAAAERMEARLELQVTLLEGTALAVAARRATWDASAAAALAPLAERLRDAGIELQAEAEAGAELGA